ncbi:MAG TPA: lipopolysaccharide heptosyltransferase II [Geobacteraceae bacterium]
MVKGNARKNILVLRYRFIGDTILTVPFLRNLRRAEPDARIVWVVDPATADVVKGIPYVDELVFWDPARPHGDGRGTHRTLRDKLRFVRELHRRRFDKVYVLKRSLSSAIIALLTGARSRVGFNTEGRGPLLTTRVPYRHDRHEVENFLAVLRADRVPVHDTHLEAWLSADEQGFAARFLELHGVGAGEKLVGIHPFASNQVRAWHEENFIAVANELQGRYGARIVLFGGERDREPAARMAERIVPAPVMAVGETTLRQSMALLARCGLLVCNDSGVMHLGAALGVPLVAIFGPQSPVKFGPWGERCRVVHSGFPCSPCRQKFFTECEPSPRGKPRCLEAISVQMVLDQVENIAGNWFRGR